MERLIDEPLAQSGLKRNYFGICELQKNDVRGVNEGKPTLYVWHSLAKPRIMPLAAQNARFVRASKFRSDENATLYVVAVSEPDHAIEIVRGKVADFSDDVEDLGRVSRALVRALDLAPGNFIRIDQVRRQSQSSA